MKSFFVHSSTFNVAAADYWSERRIYHRSVLLATEQILVKFTHIRYCNYLENYIRYISTALTINGKTKT